MASLVTNAGLGMVTAGLHAYASRPKFLQWGEGSGQGVTDTTINNVGSTTEDRVDGTSSVETETTTDDTYQVVGTIAALGTRAITELGVFDAAGNMGMYGDFTAIDLSFGDSIDFVVRVTFDQAS